MKVRSMTMVRGLALAGAVSILIGGCGNREEVAAAPVAETAAAPVADTMAPTASTAMPPTGTTVGTEIDDSVITARVKAALLADGDSKGFEIKVETRKGQVQLSGYVDTQARIDNAVALTSKVEGVTDVENAMSLKVGNSTVGNAVDDGIVTAKVKSALLADADVKSFDIAIVTRKGDVQLSGFVDNQAQINRAIDVARGVEGVQFITNEMSIKK
ncbi:MAG: BON domain-containing protein [Burkholderiales bacterium]|nr:BON domain-containing protein [Burkholderiales bacterium]